MHWNRKSVTNAVLSSMELWHTGHLWGESLEGGQWCGTLMFSLLLAWTSRWTKRRVAGDLRRDYAHVTSLKLMGWKFTRLYLIQKRICVQIKHIEHQAISSYTHWRLQEFSVIYELTHWGRDKMDAISQTTFSKAFSSMKIYEFRLKLDLSLFLMVRLTIFHHWFRQWLGAGQATSHYLNHWRLDYRRIYASLGLNELNEPLTPHQHFTDTINIYKCVKC